MPWSLFFECWVLSQFFQSPLSPSSKGSLVPLHSFPLEWYHLYIWGCWYFSQQSWFQLLIHPAWNFIWCTLHDGKFELQSRSMKKECSESGGSTTRAYCAKYLNYSKYHGAPQSLFLPHKHKVCWESQICRINKRDFSFRSVVQPKDTEFFHFGYSLAWLYLWDKI